MSTIGVGGSSANMEFDVAQALLDLQSNIREDNIIQSNTESYNDNKEDMEMTARLFLSCLITSNAMAANPALNISTPGSSATRIVKNSKDLHRGYAATRNEHETIHQNEVHPIEIRNEYKNNEVNSKRIKLLPKQPNQYLPLTCKKFDMQKESKYDYSTRKSPKLSSNHGKVTTREIGTQTETYYPLPKINAMESTIKHLCEKIQKLEAQIKVTNSEVRTFKNQSMTDDEELENSMGTSYHDKIHSNGDDTLMDTSNVNRSSDDDHSLIEKPRTHTNNTCRVLSDHNRNSNSNDMIPIGEGYASVPSRLLRHINWNSYTSATRKLLTAVFSRSVLATHSLTGKPSPAFPNKPAKKKLDPALVNDIVQTVVERCCVPENVVRTSITTKCADESKMFRTRQKNVRKRKHKIDTENIPPESTDSEDN